MDAPARTNLTTPGPEGTLSALQWVLRLGVFLCFLGHGSYALLAKPEWAAFFGVVGMPPDAGLVLMPWVGLLDLTIASFALASPRPIVFLWAAVWCLWTAALRPLSGLGMWEFWARAGNYGIPIAFLALGSWPRSLREWLSPVTSGPVSAERLRAGGFVLRTSIVLFLIGHAGLALFQQKEGLLSLYAKAGLPSTIGGVALAPTIGWFELALALAVLLKPVRALLLAVCALKIAVGLLSPAAGAYWWEFIEHGADYMAPIALILIGKALGARMRVPESPQTLVPVGAASVVPAPAGAAPGGVANRAAEPNPST